MVAIGVILSQFFTVTLVLLLASKRKFKVLNFVSKDVLWIVLDIALLGVFISLFYSDAVGFAPCILCWYQRIFMYPIVPIFALALIKKDRNILDYGLILSILGFLISVYHILIYYFNLSVLPCGATGISCVQHFVSEIGGYVSIPMMSMTGFLLLISVLLVGKFYPKISAQA